MPFSADIRTGPGSWIANVNTYFEYLDDGGKEIVVINTFCPSEVQYHNETLEAEIEDAMERYILCNVFDHEHTDHSITDPTDYNNVWLYTHTCVCRLINRKSEWYILRNVE
jgi:hypothetical protein